MMNSPEKICLIVDCLSKGGAEKVAAFLSESFQNNNYKVSIISLRDDIDYPYSGELFNLGTNEPSNKILKQLKKLYLFKKNYNKIDADIYIDFRVRSRFFMELILHFFVFRPEKMVMTVHSDKILHYLPKYKFFIKRLYKKVKAVVVVSERTLFKMKELYGFRNVFYIPNLYSSKILNLSNNEEVEFNKPYFLAVGRLDNETKQFDKLILAYKKSLPFKNNVPLVILGEGKDKIRLEALIEKNNVQEKIKLEGFVKNPYPYMKNCKTLLLSSKYEGFGMVLIESLALGTPVISFDCKSGPSEIIENGKNGLLVKDQDFEAFIEAINTFYSNKELYKECKLNAYKSSLKFSEKKVIRKWLNLFNDDQQS